MNKSRIIKIVYFGGGWSTNIGNSFIDLGSIQSLKMACPNSIIYFASEMPKWLFYSKGKDFNKAFEVASAIKADCAVVSGMMLCDEFIKLYESTISKLIKNNVKVIINGGGGSTYTQKEIDNVRNFLKRYPLYAFISRDKRAFENYNDLAEHSYNGIDCAFFLSDYFTPAKLNLPDFVVFNFDESKIYKFLKSVKNKSVFKKTQIQNLKINDKLIIRTHHSSWPNILKKDFNESNTLISDIPDDYLHLYANTKATYSDRVHACIATLSFDNPAMLFSQTPRALLFDKIGANTIREKLTYPEVKKIQKEKSKQITFLSEVIK